MGLPREFLGSSSGIPREFPFFNLLRSISCFFFFFVYSMRWLLILFCFFFAKKIIDRYQPVVTWITWLLLDDVIGKWKEAARAAWNCFHLKEKIWIFPPFKTKEARPHFEEIHWDLITARLSESCGTNRFSFVNSFVFVC